MMDRPAGRRQLDLLVRAANALEHNRIPPPIRAEVWRYSIRNRGVQPSTQPSPFVLPKKGSEVTPESIQAALKGDTTRTTQDAVSLPAVQRYVDRLLNGEVPPPIKMDEQVIVEGNHRYIAAKVVGKTVEVQPWRAPAGKVTKPISDIKIDPVDWGNK